MATLTLLAAERIATLQRAPRKGEKREKWDMWIEDLVEWMVREEWVPEEESKGGSRSAQVRRARVTANEYEIKGEPELRVLNLGEDEGQLRGRY